MTDQQRNDTLFTEVGGEAVTPVWNLLASEGTRFVNTYTSCPLCVPARTSLATGMNPLRSGMLLNDLPGKMAQDHLSLHRMLYEAGYEVAHIGVNHISLKPPLPQSLPFSAWEDDESYAAFAKSRGVSVTLDPEQRSQIDELWEGAYTPRFYSNAKVRHFEHNLSLFKDVWFANKAVEFINREHEKPFALFVCLWAPHPPLVVPPLYTSLFPPESVSLPPFHGMPAEGEPRSRRRGAAGQLGELASGDDWREIWAAHYALTRLADDQLGAIIAALKDNGFFEETLVVCTVDHGEQLGEHLMYQKMEMYESAVRVPAVFHMPSAPPSTHHVPISHLNFVPTILDLLEIPDAPDLEANSLAQCVLDGRTPDEYPVFAVYNGNHAIGDIRRMVVHDGYKYVWDGSEGELYDLVEDPYERVNLDGHPKWRQRREALHNRLASWALEQGDWIDYTRRE